MKQGIVMQIDEAYLTLLTPDGQFLHARKQNIPYVIGEEILFTPVERSTRAVTGFRRLLPVKPLLAAATVLMLLMGSYLLVYQSEKAYAYMSIDVNPSIELGVNKQMKVVELTPFNADGKKVISRIDHWQGQDVKKIAKTILEQMKQEGYFKANHVVIISTVRTEKTEASIEKKLTENMAAIKTTVKKDRLQLNVLSGTKTEMEKAHKLGMTTGKYKEKQELVNQNQEIPKGQKMIHIPVKKQHSEKTQKTEKEPVLAQTKTIKSVQNHKKETTVKKAAASKTQRSVRSTVYPNYDNVTVIRNSKPWRHALSQNTKGEAKKAEVNNKSFGKQLHEKTKRKNGKSGNLSHFGCRPIKNSDHSVGNQHFQKTKKENHEHP